MVVKGRGETYGRGCLIQNQKVEKINVSFFKNLYFLLFRVVFDPLIEGISRAQKIRSCSGNAAANTIYSDIDEVCWKEDMQKFQASFCRLDW